MIAASQRSKVIIKKLLTELEISDARYVSAERSYLSIGEWLNRSASSLSSVKAKVYLQGSFRLGTAIKPVDDSAEDYDLDMVCEVAFDKSQLTQEQLQNLLGDELKAYAKAYGMAPPEKWDRGWTLNYSDNARFHIDFLPAVPDGIYQRRIQNEMGAGIGVYVDQSIAITDRQHANFRRISYEWPVSNPNGYAIWFKDQMNRAALVMNKAQATRDQVEVADMPSKQRRDSPLQSAVKLLKRHRDLMFVDDPEDRPSSIILTTLAGYAYGNEIDPFEAVLGILTRVDQFIVQRQDGIWIENPADKRENFADSWRDNPRRKGFFLDWLESARADFRAAAVAQNDESIVELLAPRLGRKLVENSVSADGKIQNSIQVRSSSAPPAILQDAPHRRPLRWPVDLRHKLKLVEATYRRDGFRPADFRSGERVPQGSSLRFVAQTDVRRPYKLYWQIVNTGAAAKTARDLRGTFDEEILEQGDLVREERAKYQGTHSIQCFVVKDGQCVASSDMMVVPIL